MAQSYGFESAAFKAAIEAVNKHRAEIKKKPGVVGVRAGYRVVDQWVTTIPAIVVSVDKKKLPSELGPDDKIPTQLDGIPTDVTTASAKETKPATPAGDLLGDLTGPLDDVRVDENAPFDDPAADAINQTKYEKLFPGDPSRPSRFPNAASPGDINVLCHAGPDAGWAVLSQFLKETKKSLLVAMYDFKAAYILQGVVSAINAVQNGQLDLIIDPDLTDEEDAAMATLATLTNFHSTLASVNNKTGVFASAYHPKVAVRDSKAFWLSSGNWSPSSQPEQNPFSKSPRPVGMLKSKNREYHIVIEHPQMAEEMALYINHDIDLSRQFPAAKPPGPGTDQDVLIPAEAFDALFVKDDFTEAAPLQFFEPKSITLKGSNGDFAQPLFTQENYIERIIDLVRSATDKIYLQFQYVRYRDNSPPEFKELIGLLKKKIDDKMDVRVIIGHRDARRDLENLVGIELDISKFKVQMNCHNKGLLVDDKFVVVGSQNWSGDGTVRNRDASVMFSSTEVFKYYEGIFLHDWNGLAEKKIRESAIPVQVVNADQVTPSGMIRMSWSDAFDD